MPPLLITAVGLTAQAFFSARTLVQWIMSEKARRVLSPAVFWVLSVAGAYLLAIYGWLRQDFAIVLGQFASIYVYLWNLKMKRVKLPRIAWWVLGLIPVIALASVAGNYRQFVADFFGRPDLPMWLIVFGSTGQVLFTLRFIYQWLYSRRVGESELPPAFWWISLIGAVIIFSYAVMRIDAVLMLGQGFGLFVYARNLMIGRKAKE